MLSPELQRVLKIKEYCDDVAETIDRYGASHETFQKDKAYQYTISFCILQIGEMVGGLTEEYRRLTGAKVPWHMIRAMRNIVAHDYGAIRLDTVWQVATTDIPNLKAFCEEELSKAREG